MLSTQQYPLTMDKWDVLEPSEQTWSTWKTMFKDAEKKEKIHKQATGRKDQFGAAHCATGEDVVMGAAPGSSPWAKPKENH